MKHRRIGTRKKRKSGEEAKQLSFTDSPGCISLSIAVCVDRDSRVLQLHKMGSNRCLFTCLSCRYQSCRDWNLYEKQKIQHNLCTITSSLFFLKATTIVSTLCIFFHSRLFPPDSGTTCFLLLPGEGKTRQCHLHEQACHSQLRPNDSPIKIKDTALLIRRSLSFLLSSLIHPSSVFSLRSPFLQSLFGLPAGCLHSIRHSYLSPPPCPSVHAHPYCVLYNSVGLRCAFSLIPSHRSHSFSCHQGPFMFPVSLSEKKKRGLNNWYSWTNALSRTFFTNPKSMQALWQTGTLLNANFALGPQPTMHINADKSWQNGSAGIRDS